MTQCFNSRLNMAISGELRRARRTNMVNAKRLPSVATTITITFLSIPTKLTHPIFATANQSRLAVMLMSILLEIKALISGRSHSLYLLITMCVKFLQAGSFPNHQQSSNGNSLQSTPVIHTLVEIT